MKRLLESRLLCAAALIAGILATSGPAAGQTKYVVANDDQSGVVFEGVSFYTVSSKGLLTLKKEVSTGGFGISGGYFGADRIRTISGSQGCVYSSEATTGDVV